MAWAAPMMPVPTTPIPRDCGIVELQDRIVSTGGGQILKFFVCIKQEEFLFYFAVFPSKAGSRCPNARA
jgi:hypothetical protein